VKGTGDQLFYFVLRAAKQQPSFPPLELAVVQIVGIMATTVVIGKHVN
jgi:hypothetical protein